MEELNTLENTLAESLQTLEEKKNYSKDMNRIINNASKLTGLDAKVIRRVKDYRYYRGLGWMGSSLSLDKEEKFKDRVSPAFIKIKTIIEDCVATHQEELLKDYIDDLSEFGIKIDFSECKPDKIISEEDAKIVDETVNDGCDYQKEICQRADMIKDKHAPLAETNGFGPESEYKKLIELLYKKRALDKDIAEKVNEGYAKHKLAEKSYIYVINDGDVEDN